VLGRGLDIAIASISGAGLLNSVSCAFIVPARMVSRIKEKILAVLIGRI